jgi:hypothetical protein
MSLFVMLRWLVMDKGIFGRKHTSEEIFGSPAMSLEIGRKSNQTACKHQKTKAQI